MIALIPWIGAMGYALIDRGLKILRGEQPPGILESLTPPGSGVGRFNPAISVGFGRSIAETKAKGGAKAFGGGGTGRVQ